MARIKDSRHLTRVAALCCIICRKTGLAEDSPALCHHIRHGNGTGQRGDDITAIPLCSKHHDYWQPHGFHHLGTRAWEEMFWPEEDLLAETLAELGITPQNTPKQTADTP